MADASIIHVTDASFDADVLDSDEPVLLDIWADWCWPCRMMAPILDEIAGELKGKVRIAKLDTVDNPKTPRRFNVQGIPTLILFKGGQVLARTDGALRKADLLSFVQGKLR